MNNTKFGRERIISTYVKNTLSPDEGFTFAKDHLHLRGEYYQKSENVTALQGSSPLTWRILRIDGDLDNDMRIISTYVENTKRPVR